jgi:actin-like protein 6A
MLGDDIGAVVINVGHFETRCGEAGEDTPKSVIPSWVGVSQIAGINTEANNPNGMEVENPIRTNSYSTGDALNVYKEDMRVSSPFVNGGVDWDLYFELVGQSLKNLHIDPAERPLMFTEPSATTSQFRTQLIERAFETYKPSGFFVAKEATLTCYASGRATSLVVDSGSQATTVCAVHDGFVLTNSLISSPIAGDSITQALYYNIANKHRTVIRPSYSFKKKKVQTGNRSSWNVTPNNLNFNETFHNYHVSKVLHDIKMAYCKIPDRGAEAIGIRLDIELPDSSIVPLDGDSIYAPEQMFKTITEAQGVHQMVANCIGSCDVDIKKDLFGGVIITGGNTLFPGFVEKLQRNIVPPTMYKLKVIAPTDSAERRFSSWTGGSILGSLGSMHAMWVSKAEYEEIGSLIVEKKCP